MPQAELNSIPEQIHAEAVRQSQQQLERARRVAERHIAAAKSRVEDMEEQLQQELGLLLKHEVDRTLARAEIEARNKKLAFRESILEEVIGEAIAKLANVPRGEAYEKLIHKLVLEGVREVGTPRVKLLLNSQDTRLLQEPGRTGRLEEFLRRKLDEKVSVELFPEPIDCAGGVVVRSLDGRISYYNTFEELLSGRRDEIRREVERKVFQEDDD